MLKKKILFVCTGNVFRSLSAEYLFRKFLEDSDISDTEVSSAGTHADTSRISDEATTEALKNFGVVIPHRSPRLLTKNDLLSADVVIALADYHIEFMRNTFDFDEAVLFNQIVNEQNTSVPDIEDVVKDYETNRQAVEKHLWSTVTYIHSNIPKLHFQLEERYTLFSDFVCGRKKTNYAYEVIMLTDTKYAAAFMSTSIPEGGDAHVLVVPKKRYMNVYNIPTIVLKDMDHIMSKIGKAFNNHYDGYNILLNNGTAAGQYIYHAHYHMIPRKKGDGIEFETWTNKYLTKDEFDKQNFHLKDLISKFFTNE